MKTLVRICVGILLAVVAVRGQAPRQNGNAVQDSRPISIIQEPKVLGTGDTWAVISWTTNAAGKHHAAIKAGTSQNNLKSVDQTLADNTGGERVESYQEQEYSHVVRLNNLQPGTTYYFQADSGSASDHGAGSTSNIWTFTTAGVAQQKAAALNASSKRPATKSHTAQARARQTSSPENPQTASLPKPSPSPSGNGSAAAQQQ